MALTRVHPHPPRPGGIGGTGHRKRKGRRAATTKVCGRGLTVQQQPGGNERARVTWRSAAPGAGGGRNAVAYGGLEAAAKAFINVTETIRVAWRAINVMLS